jgi:hypothetical protein
VLLRSLIDFILELLRELQGDGNCHYTLPRSYAVHGNITEMQFLLEMKIYERLSSGLGKLQFYFEIVKLVENMLIYRSLGSVLGKLQFYFEIQNLVEDMLIYTSLGSGLGKLQFYFEIVKLVENMLIYTSFV